MNKATTGPIVLTCASVLLSVAALANFANAQGLPGGTRALDCSAVIVGNECIGTVISGTGNVNQSGGSNRPLMLSAII